MGCWASKKLDATTPYVYSPAPSSFAIFDINAIEEPWLKLDDAAQQLNDQQKSSHVPTHYLLEKLDTLEKDGSGAPRSWEEVSKDLEVLKEKKPAAKPDKGTSPVSGPPPRKSFSFHTLEELEAKKDDDHKKRVLTRGGKTESTHLEESSGDDEAKKQLSRLRKTELNRDEFPGRVVVNSGGVGGSLKANPFIVRDRIEKEKEGKEAVFYKIMKTKRDPLDDFPEVCPPSGSHLVVLYTTSLGGVRKTFEDCNRIRAILENHRVVFDERDVSLHGPFLGELKDLVGTAEGAVVPVPRLFVKGRYLGGREEIVELNESGRLGRILSSARVERGVGWQGCEGCGGARFVPCMECGGSCKLIVGDEKERCPKCNENGLVQCPLCH